MTLILTAIAAIVTTVLYLRDKAAGAAKRLPQLACAYWGASLMWCVDGFASMAEGESFVELADTAAMADDALLGVLVVAIGVAFWAAYNAVAKKRVPAAA